MNIDVRFKEVKFTLVLFVTELYLIYTFAMPFFDDKNFPPFVELLNYNKDDDKAEGGSIS